MIRSVGVLDQVRYSTVLRGAAKAVAWSLGLWALQLLPVLARLPSGSSVQPWYGLASIALTLLVAPISLIPRHSAGRGAVIGVVVGAALGFVHFLTLGAIMPPPIWFTQAVADELAVSITVGAIIGWTGALAPSRLGIALTAVAILSGLVVVDNLTRFAMNMPTLFWQWIALASAILTLCCSILVGALLSEFGALSSRNARELRQRFRVLAEALPIPLVLTCADNQRILFANERSRQQFLIPPTDSKTDAFYTDLADRERLAELIQREGGVENHEVEMRHADGSTFWALSSARSLTFGGEPAILTGYVDITDRKAAEEALLASEVRYALISRAANDGIWDWDIPSGTVYFSARWKEIVGAESNRRLTTLDDWFSRVHPDDVVQLKREIDEHITGRTPQLDTEYRLRHGDGHYCWMQCRGIVLRGNGGVPIRMAGSQSDITLRKTYEINLRNAAYEDRLTGISNRAFFTHLVDTRNSAESIRNTAILLVNVDQFRRVNDSLGTGAGDALLISIARRLAGRAKPQDELARLGGDEFAVWLQDVTDHEAAVKIARTILNDLSYPFELGDAQLPITISAGIAAPTAGGAISGGDLLHNARLALDRSRTLGGDQLTLFDDALLSETKLRQRLSRDLASAGRLGQIFFEYQPVMSLGQNGKIDGVAGFEALMRWRHPELGLIPPAKFVPLAEEAGLIGPLGMLAIEHAAREIADWTDAGLTPALFSVAVNLSARQISDATGVQRLFGLLDRLTLPPGRLKLEITESVLMNDPDAMATTFHELRQRGVELSLDDFGTGYSSLSYLHRFPLNVLKIDRSFVTRMLRAPEALRLVRSIIELAHDLGLGVVAEGVESQEEVECLRNHGCDYAQGYFFSRPVPADQAKLLLSNGLVRH